MSLCVILERPLHLIADELQGSSLFHSCHALYAWKTTYDSVHDLEGGAVDLITKTHSCAAFFRLPPTTRMYRTPFASKLNVRSR